MIVHFQIVNLKNKERTEINFETFKNYIFKLSPMSPSMRPDKVNLRNRMEDASFDISEEDTTSGEANTII